ncbi:MAG TPA: helix-turn-helix domain-containing protein [Dehalococcoidia bacterium]|nr:helix-turn-helix domain-containing protein [Dehalococcoidia bacterium]
MSRSYSQPCPIARTLDIVGDRWTILIVRDLFLGKTRFQEFLASSPGMPPKLLSDRLKRLEGYRLVERSIYSQHPLRAEYRLTQKGRTLEPVISAMVSWGLEHTFDDEPGMRAAVERKVRGEMAAQLGPSSEPAAGPA